MYLKVKLCIDLIALISGIIEAMMQGNEDKGRPVCSGCVVVTGVVGGL